MLDPGLSRAPTLGAEFKERFQRIFSTAGYVLSASAGSAQNFVRKKDEISRNLATQIVFSSDAFRFSKSAESV